MKLIGIKTSTKGKTSVTLKVYDCDNILEYMDQKNNFHKITHVSNFKDAQILFYEWTLKMYNIKHKIELV